MTYQVFIEPKRNHLKAHDKWKEDFLKGIRDKKEVIEIHSDKYLITGVLFYNNEDENEFKETLENTLNEANTLPSRTKPNAKTKNRKRACLSANAFLPA